MKRTTSLLLAGSLALGVAVFSILPASSNSFGGAEPVSCGAGMDCTSDTFTAAASSGSGFTCNSSLADCLNMPGACTSVGTDGTNMYLGGTGCSPTIRIGGSGNISITGSTITNTNGGLDMNNNATIMNSTASKPVLFNDADGVRITCYAATPACAAGSTGSVSCDADDSRAYYCDGTTVQRVAFSLTASASLNFASMADNAEATATMTVTGAATTDAVSCNPTAAIEAGIHVAYAYVSSANTVTVVALNGSGGVVDPAAATYACAVVR